MPQHSHNEWVSMCRIFTGQSLTWDGIEAQTYEALRLSDFPPDLPPDKKTAAAEVRLKIQSPAGTSWQGTLSNFSESSLKRPQSRILRVAYKHVTGNIRMLSDDFCCWLKETLFRRSWHSGTFFLNYIYSINILSKASPTFQCIAELRWFFLYRCHLDAGDSCFSTAIMLYYGCMNEDSWIHMWDLVNSTWHLNLALMHTQCLSGNKNYNHRHVPIHNWEDIVDLKLRSGNMARHKLSLYCALLMRAVMFSHCIKKSAESTGELLNGL